MLFRHDLSLHAKDKIYLALIVFVPTILAYFIADHLMSVTILLLLISGLTALFAPYYLASHICVNMRTKQDAINFAMLPATNLEKFIVRFVDYGILPTLIVLFDLLLIALTLFFFYSIGHFDDVVLKMKMLFDPTVIEQLKHDLQEILKVPFLPSLATLWVVNSVVGYMSNIHAMTLGGCYFNRFAMVKTWLVIMGIGAVLQGFVSVGVGFGLHLYPAMLDDLNNPNPEVVLEHFQTLFIVCSIINTVLAAALLYFTYVLFKRKQICK